MSAKALGFPGEPWDREVVERSADSRLILELYDREQLSLRRYLVWLGLDTGSAEETMQESFLKLQEHLLAQGERTHLRAWLYRVAHNLARNAQMSFRVAKSCPLDSASETPSESASVEDALLEQEKHTRLKRGVKQLSEAQRNCLALRSQGLKYREIADALNLSVSTVAENVQRGLQRLREIV